MQNIIQTQKAHVRSAVTISHRNRWIFGVILFGARDAVGLGGLWVVAGELI